MAFKYAFNTWVYGSFPVWVPAYTLDEAIRRLARIGYDGIEIGCAAPHAWPAHLDAGRRRALRDLMKSEGLPCVSLLPAPGGGPGNNPASPLPEERTATIAHYKEVVDLAHDLGAEKVLYIAGWRIFGTEQAQAWDWSLQAVREIAGYAADKGVTIVHRADLGRFQPGRHRRRGAAAARAERQVERQGDVRHLPCALPQRAELGLRLRDGAASGARALRRYRPVASGRGRSATGPASCRR